ARQSSFAGGLTTAGSAPAARPDDISITIANGTPSRTVMTNSPLDPASPDRGRRYFLSDDKYATSASTSSFGNEYCFISGLRGGLVLAIIPFASTIQARIS